MQNFISNISICKLLFIFLRISSLFPRIKSRRDDSSVARKKPPKPRVPEGRHSKKVPLLRSSQLPALLLLQRCRSSGAIRWHAYPFCDSGHDPRKTLFYLQKQSPGETAALYPRRGPQNHGSRRDGSSVARKRPPKPRVPEGRHSKKVPLLRSSQLPVLRLLQRCRSSGAKR